MYGLYPPAEAGFIVAIILRGLAGVVAIIFMGGLVMEAIGSTSLGSESSLDI